MKEQNITASEKNRMLFCFLQKYPFGECVFLKINYNIIYKIISISVFRKKGEKMRRVVVDMQNYLFADAIAQALKRADSDFDVRMSESPDKTAELCNLSKPYALLCEVTGYTPWMLEERLKIRDEVKCYSPECKIVLIVDENAEKTLARRVLQAKKDGLIDNFIYSSVSAAYLSAVVDTL